MESNQQKKIRIWALSTKNNFNSDDLQRSDKILESEEDYIKTIYFKKTFQRLFDDDNLYRSILHGMHELLPQDLKEKLRIMICNEIENKIRKFLN